MNWLRENRSLFLIVPGIFMLGAVWFLLNARGDWNDASARFHQAAAELNRLERLAPYPSGGNLRQMTVYADDYEAAVTKLKDELRMHVLPLPRLAPNEFQSQLRVAMTAVAEKARANGVKLSDKFYLGFDEFASALPNEVAAPLLGQELAQVEWLLNTLFEARVDSLISFRRTPLPEENGTTAVVSNPTPMGRKPGATTLPAPTLSERNVVEATFVSTPAVARRVLNQIAGASQQFFIVRLLHVRNEKDKGPPREVAGDTTGVVAAASSRAPAGSPEAKPSAATALNFIVGNERIETTAKIEIVRFTF
jgi:hypothetical protein